jgi:hypothetical protein
MNAYSTSALVYAGCGNANHTLFWCNQFLELIGKRQPKKGAASIFHVASNASILSHSMFLTVQIFLGAITVLFRSIRQSRVTPDLFYCGNNFFSIYPKYFGREKSGVVSN